MNTNAPASLKPLRLWPGVAAAALLLALKYLAPRVLENGGLIATLGSMAAGAAIVLWWLFFSRARWRERLGILALTIAATAAVRLVVHPSIAGGMMGLMLVAMAVQMLPVALVIGAVIGQRFAPHRRTAAISAAVLIACASFTLIRTDGLFGGASQLSWRWTPTAEDRLLAQAQDTPPPAPVAAPAASPATAAPAARVEAEPAAAASRSVAPVPVKMDVRWPGFRGGERNSVVRGVQIPTDWTTAPPAEIWRRPIGPGWSSFAVAGDLLFTQEQRGPDEIVAAYRINTGKPAWMHKDPVRFYESNGGAGPRGTPTVSGGRVYALGATGILKVLDAATGAAVWKRDAIADAAIKLPGWGITSSPVVLDDIVVVAVSGALLGYDRESGNKRWFVKSRGGSYSSPQFAVIDGVPQVLLLAGAGLTSVAPSTGTVLWSNDFAGVPIVQPAVIGERDVLFSSSDAMGGLGTRRLAVSHSGDQWQVEERWTTNGLKPYFNDYVVHEGHAYGFDGNILACIDLADGTRKWKGGRYGNGQILLLAEQDLLLVVSEAGELALVRATPDQFTEVAARIPAIEGKTWNHPVVVGDRLYLRNGQEMAAFRLGVQNQ
ncbi:MAG TPA: PQQ-binding-like beta-propeller repeat protein [Vicinamibacterales bacterium]|nr:PQQ-binding-like beta-propeller repeat protein [Vicinamibacterales bacterium]